MDTSVQAKRAGKSGWEEQADKKQSGQAQPENEAKRKKLLDLETTTAETTTEESTKTRGKKQKKLAVTKEEQEQEQEQQEQEQEVAAEEQEEEKEQQHAPFSILMRRNSHEPDSHIRFEAEGHHYFIDYDVGVKYTSVTTWIHSKFPHFDADSVIANMMRGRNWNESNQWWGMTADEIKAAWNTNGQVQAQLGTELHERIEHFMNNDALPPKYTLYDLYNDNNNKAKQDKRSGSMEKQQEDPKRSGSMEQAEDPKRSRRVEDPKEWDYFQRFVLENGDLVPYRTEWMVFLRELRLSGSIDMVFENVEDGTLSIYDWKRAKEMVKDSGKGNVRWKKYATDAILRRVGMEDSNFWHYSLQLNVYKRMLEIGYGVRVRDLCLVRLHPNAETYELYFVDDMTELVDELFAARQKEINGVSEN